MFSEFSDDCLLNKCDMNIALTKRKYQGENYLSHLICATGPWKLIDGFTDTRS